VRGVGTEDELGDCGRRDRNRRGSMSARTCCTAVSPDAYSFPSAVTVCIMITRNVHRHRSPICAIVGVSAI